MASRKVRASFLSAEVMHILKAKDYDSILPVRHAEMWKTSRIRYVCLHDHEGRPNDSLLAHTAQCASKIIMVYFCQVEMAFGVLANPLG